MDIFPEIDLSDYERKFVRTYKTKDKPGVLKRVYHLDLISQAWPEAGFPTVQLRQSIQFSRRARIFGLSFIGDTDVFHLEIFNSSGTHYTLQDTVTNNYPLVSSMVQGTNRNSLAYYNVLLTYPKASVTGEHRGIMVVEPNWLLIPNEQLIFSAVLSANANTYITEGEGTYYEGPWYLGIGIHSWEFPGMSEEREE